MNDIYFISGKGSSLQRGNNFILAHLRVSISAFCLTLEWQLASTPYRSSPRDSAIMIVPNFIVSQPSYFETGTWMCLYLKQRVSWCWFRPHFPYCLRPCALNTIFLTIIPTPAYASGGPCTTLAPTPRVLAPNLSRISGIALSSFYHIRTSTTERSKWFRRSRKETRGPSVFGSRTFFILRVFRILPFLRAPSGTIPSITFENTTLLVSERWLEFLILEMLALHVGQRRCCSTAVRCTCKWHGYCLFDINSSASLVRGSLLLVVSGHTNVTALFSFTQTNAPEPIATC